MTTNAVEEYIAKEKAIATRRDGFHRSVAQSFLVKMDLSSMAVLPFPLDVVRHTELPTIGWPSRVYDQTPALGGLILG